MKKEEKKKLFKEFLEKNHVLIVDKNGASRRRLMKTIIDMGGKRHQVHSVFHFSDAVDIVEQYEPRLILSDYAVSGGSGFDLFSEYKKRKPIVRDATCILITSNISQSAVAKAAEEDVDSFIIKPYTVTSLEANLVKAVINKLYPDKYIQAIDKGKEQLMNGDYAGALVTFEEAIQLNKKPSLALFYHGQAKYFMELSEDANKDYKKGLSYNSIHFKCQVGLYELFMKEEKYFDAYGVVRNIAKYFPANPGRLKEVVRLAVVTKNYKDMVDYYDIFKELEERTSDVITYVCAGMYVYGKYSLLHRDSKTAKDIFEKVGISCAGATRFLRAMITELHLHNLHDDAKKLLSRFPSDTLEEEDYQVSAYLAESKDMDEGNRITGGIDLLNKGFKDFNSMLVLIESLCKDDKLDKAEEYLFEVHKWWPERKKEAKIHERYQKKEDNRDIEGKEGGASSTAA